MAFIFPAAPQLRFARWSATATVPPRPSAPVPSPSGRADASFLSPSSLPAPRVIPPAPVLEPSFKTKNIGDAWDMTPVTENAYWRLMLMSDGHLEGHLHVMTSGQLRMELVETLLMSEMPARVNNGCGNGVGGIGFSAGFGQDTLLKLLPQPWRRRQIHLLDNQGRVLVHATSWWDASLYDTILGPDESRTIWQALNDLKFGIARSVLGVEFGPCPAKLRDEFSCGDTGVWARHMVLKRDRRPMAILCEILSPTLAEYLGPMTEPFEGYEQLLEENKHML